MRKRMAGILCLLLVFTALSGCAKARTGADLPTVFVHGYTGWGSYDERNEHTPYFGLGATNIESALTRRGYAVYMASVGPHSSAWDRACELYAEITGTRVDYGAAHSAQCGHERYGRDYSARPLIPDFTWDAKHPINLVGHSFGGTTIRLLEDLLADGAPEEIAATGEDTSPLFTGGHGDWVFSITLIASPSDGTTGVYLDSSGSVSGTVNGTYDPYLDQFGIYGDTEETAAAAMASADFYGHYDSAVNDMSVDRACAMNAAIELQPNVYYFIYYGTRTTVDASGSSVPTDAMSYYLRDFSARMGSYTSVTPGQYTVGYGAAQQTFSVPQQNLDVEWQPNDGMVNAVSAYCPYHLDATGQRVYDAHEDYTDGAEIRPGVWNILPRMEMDHFGFIGGINTEKAGDVIRFYADIMSRIAELTIQ